MEIRGGRNTAIMSQHGWYVGGYFVRQATGELPALVAATACCPDSECPCDEPEQELDIAQAEELLAACKELDQTCYADTESTVEASVMAWLPLLLQLLPVVIELWKKRSAT